MYKEKLTFLLVFVHVIVFGNKIYSQNIFSINLKTLNGKSYALKEEKKNSATVFIFIAPDCPLCQNYSLTLNEQIKKFSQKKINYIGIISGKLYTIQEINHYKKLFNVQFELLLDEKYLLKTMLGATITPEVFLINNLGKTLYSGRIDDWAYEIGKYKPTASEHNLSDAIKAHLTKKPIKVKKTKAVGCILE